MQFLVAPVRSGSMGHLWQRYEAELIEATGLEAASEVRMPATVPWNPLSTRMRARFYELRPTPFGTWTRLDALTINLHVLQRGRE